MVLMNDRVASNVSGHSLARERPFAVLSFRTVTYAGRLVRGHNGHPGKTPGYVLMKGRNARNPPFPGAIWRAAMRRERSLAGYTAAYSSISFSRV